MNATKYDYKIARLEHNKKAREDLIKLATNPVFEILAAYIIIETLQRATLDGRNPVIPSLAGTAAEAACVVAVGLQQLAPLAPYMASSAQGLGSGIGDLGKALPLLSLIK